MIKFLLPELCLVGDAARQVNPLSGGGIASGMIGGKIAGTIAGEAIKQNKLDHILTYDKAWADRLGKRHETFNRIKEGIYNFSDDKFNNIAHSILTKFLSKKEHLARVFTTALNEQSIFAC
ncbi:MAG: hypothetical protein MZV64_52045 [Ignavibacteriales bacterium]|nr:hypothetical protein [Ignavibacteriales bacterium]